MSTSRMRGPTDLIGFRLERTGDVQRVHGREQSSPFQRDEPRALSVAPKPGWTLSSRPQFALAFLASGPPRQGLRDEDFRAAAVSLGAEVDAIKTLARLDTGEPAFDALGRPAMRFDGRQFRRHTAGRSDEPYEPTSFDGDGPLSEQYELLQQAYELDPSAALKCASWGRFRVRGSSFRAAGCETVNQFVLAISQSEAAHLTTFVHVVQSNRTLRDAVRASDWRSFATHYVG